MQQVSTTITSAGVTRACLPGSGEREFRRRGHVSRGSNFTNISRNNSWNISKTVLTNIYVGDTAVGGSGGRVLDERPGGCWPIFYKIFTWIFI